LLDHIPKDEILRLNALSRPYGEVDPQVLVNMLWFFHNAMVAYIVSPSHLLYLHKYCVLYDKDST